VGVVGGRAPGKVRRRPTGGVSVRRGDSSTQGQRRRAAARHHLWSAGIRGLLLRLSQGRI